MERLLHYVWQHRLYDSIVLQTTDGQRLEVIDPGLHNEDAGPDYLGAQLKIDGITWAGNVEIHTKSSDWVAHGHDQDPAYENVILHVVEQANQQVTTQSGKPIPQVELRIPDHVSANYQALLHEEHFPPCYRAVASLPRLIVRQWLDALSIERLEQKMQRINRIADQTGGDWETVCFRTMARAFGFGINGEAMEEWSSLVPLSAAGKHRDQLLQIEALFLGQAGLLDDTQALPDDHYYQSLLREYQFLSHKFGLRPMPREHWKLLRLRPYNFPQVRLSQLANLYCRGQVNLSRLLEIKDIKDARQLLSTEATPYWQTHFASSTVSGRQRKSLGQASLDSLIINAVVPLLFAYGRHRKRDSYLQKALSLLAGLGAEENKYTRIWREAGLPVHTAADSQALIQLRTKYCHGHDCLKCRFGYEYLKATGIYRSEDFLREQ